MARAANKRVRKGLAEKVKDWPSSSPGSLNPWLLLVTTKEPVWRDPYIAWEELPLTLGTAHQGFFYPDPMGFFAEICRWAVELSASSSPGGRRPTPGPDHLVHASRGKEHLTTPSRSSSRWSSSSSTSRRGRPRGSRSTRPPMTSVIPTGRSRSTRASGG